MSDISPYEYESPTFEDFKNENGLTYWWASDLMAMLGYRDMKSFNKAIDRAIKACLSLSIPHYENFIATQRQIDGQPQNDYKLTRFACYLTVMNADPKKEAVASAQVYFAEQTRRLEILVENNGEVERLITRDEIKEGNKSLNSTAQNAGVEDFAKFNNAGYMGLYNMYNFQLAKARKIEKNELYDYMGRTELAANLFRITQTEERIKSQKVKGQAHLEQTHFDVGREVRDIVIKNTGKKPEHLPTEQKLPDVQKELKKGYKKMKDLDAKSKRKPKKE